MSGARALIAGVRANPGLLVAAVALLAASSLWARPLRYVPQESNIASTRSQLATICDAVRSAPEGCGGGAPTEPGTAAQSHDPAADRLYSTMVRPMDAWGRAVRVTVSGGGVTLESAGPDGEFGSADDLVLQCSN